MNSIHAKSIGKLRYISLTLYSLMIYTNYLANALPIGGITTGEVSDLLDNLFTPFLIFDICPPLVN